MVEDQVAVVVVVIGEAERATLVAFEKFLRSWPCRGSDDSVGAQGTVLLMTSRGGRRSRGGWPVRPANARSPGS